jgi:putative colanic acid biosynthesis UDP-glucose lipid carrier transferase
MLKFLASNRFSRYIEMIFLFWDLIVLGVSYILSCYLRDGNLDSLNGKDNQTTFVMAFLIWIVVAVYKEAYTIVRIEKIYKTLGRTIKLVLIHLGGLALFIAVLNFDNVSRLRLFYFYFIFFVLVLYFRIVFLKVLKHARSKGYNFRNVIIIGANPMGERMNEILNRDLSYGYKVAGVFCDTLDPLITNKMVHLGELADVEFYLASHKVDEMYIALDDTEADQIPILIHLCERYMVRLKIIPNFQQYTKVRRVNIEFYENTPVLTLRKEPQEFIRNRLLKKGFDFVFSLGVSVLIFSWLFPILILLVKLSSKGPAFFKQKRSGENNKTFTCYKFRTMRVNALSDELQSQKNDPRITKLGAFMRRTNLDELPQFFNVLLGKMSVVGPRPHMLKHTEQYSELINNYLVRHFVKPGITGWAQVKGYRGETKELIDMKNRVEFDIWYLENWTFLLDFKIIWMTVTNMLRGEKNAN